jgi:hypothetical protein
MNKRIIYPNDNGGFSVLIPTGDIELAEVCRKDVPANTPYIIIDESLIPTDREFRNAWEADFSNPDGYGIGQDAWFAEQEAKKPPTPEPTPTVIKKATQ